VEQPPGTHQGRRSAAAPKPHWRGPTEVRHAVPPMRGGPPSALRFGARSIALAVLD